MNNLVQVKNLKKYFSAGSTSREKNIFKKQSFIRAVDGVSFDIREGETLGLVGESGCGKSTLARSIIRLHEPDEGKILFDGEDIIALNRKALNERRRNFQIIFQDPYASLNPRMTVGSIVAEPLEVFKNKGILKITGKEIKERVKAMLDKVGLSPQFVSRYPHEFSGGQRQRIGIARALILHPKLVVCDEPVSALDVSIQSQIINLLEKLQTELKLTYLFISHDLAVVRHISDRVAVMYLGRIVEISHFRKIYSDPFHPYTKALLSDVPIADPVREKLRKRILLKGDIPSPDREFTGCRFKDRCYLKTEICETVDPPLEDKDDGHCSACHHWQQCRG